DTDALLAADDGPNARRSRGLDHRVSRIAGEKLDTLALQDFSDNVDDFHGASKLKASPLLPRRGSQYDRNFVAPKVSLRPQVVEDDWAQCLYRFSPSQY